MLHSWLRFSGLVTKHGKAARNTGKGPEALVASAGVTVSAVSAAIGLKIKNGSIRTEGDSDFRGTLGIS